MLLDFGGVCSNTLCAVLLITAVGTVKGATGNIPRNEPATAGELAAGIGHPLRVVGPHAGCVDHLLGAYDL
jgi:hypothetical protein